MRYPFLSWITFANDRTHLSTQAYQTNWHSNDIYRVSVAVTVKSAYYWLKKTVNDGHYALIVGGFLSVDTLYA